MYARVKSSTSRKIQSHSFQFLVIAAFALFIGGMSFILMPEGGQDMRDDIQPSLLSWRTPWAEGNPLLPWATIILYPLRWLTPAWATAVMNAISVVLIALVIKKFNGNPLFSLPICLSPFGEALFSNGQTDAVILACLLLPAGLDLLFFWKPQVCLHAFWVRILAAPGKYLSWILVLIPVSLLAWPGWPKEILIFGQNHLIGGWWNRSLWPYSIPLGVILVHFSIKKRDESLGLMASPLLFPYVNAASYLGFLVVAACKWPRAFGIWYGVYLTSLLLLMIH